MDAKRNRSVRPEWAAEATQGPAEGKGEGEGALLPRPRRASGRTCYLRISCIFPSSGSVPVTQPLTISNRTTG
jgi:hypothetical protein